MTKQGYAYVYLLLSQLDVSGLGYLRCILRCMALHFLFTEVHGGRGVGGWGGARS